jgi:hypothetical protein
MVSPCRVEATRQAKFEELESRMMRDIHERPAFFIG